MTEPAQMGFRRNPLIWIIIIVIGLILYLFLASDRGGQIAAKTDGSQADAIGVIDRSLLIPPGMRARGYIAQLRENGKPYALDRVFDKGNSYQREGNLADAHLLFFFSAREGYLPAMMKMGELADPILFQAQDSLLDTADGFQAYKWYQKAADLGHAAANERIDRLQDWALAAAKTGDAGARRLLLNFR
ncbi:MAG: hypothetical protein V3R76_06685 [Gammaproteobacteria bacterium]